MIINRINAKVEVITLYDSTLNLHSWNRWVIIVSLNWLKRTQILDFISY